MFPPLAGNPVVVNRNPVSLINITLKGAVLPPSPWAPSSIAMPGYATALTDQQVADVVNFIRTHWGNQALPNVKAKNVSAMRKGDVVGGETGWSTVEPQPFGSDWTFAPQTHDGVDTAQ